MNILLVHRPNEAELLCQRMLSFVKFGTYALAFPESSVIHAFTYDMRNLQWTPKPPPNVIIYPLTGMYADASQLPDVSRRLGIVFQTAMRDDCGLFILIPPIQSEEQAVFIKQQEAWLYNAAANIFVMHNADLEDSRIPGLVLSLADSGMFGRYRVVQKGASLNVKPMLMRETLWTPPVKVNG